MKYILIYLIVINIVAFALFAYDKRQAKNGGWRIREVTLLLSCFLGGWAGGLAAMSICHHKTRKPLFYIGIPVIIVLHTLLLSIALDQGRI